MKKQFLFLLLAVILLSSCATATLSEFPGVGRVKQYDFYSYDIPPAFDGFRIGFAFSGYSFVFLRHSYFVRVSGGRACEAI